MSPPETMAAFLATQLDYIFFFNGLAFFLLGAVGFAVATVWGGENSWRLLGLFGFVHGAGGWLDLIALIVVDTPIFVAIRIAVMAGSFLLLMEFARQKAKLAGAVGPAICLVIITFIVVAGMAGGLAVADALTRYTIGFFSAMATSWVFFVEARKSSGALSRLGMVTAAGFALYAIAAGLIVADAPFWPANVLSQTWFFQVAGIPIQLIRGLLACSLALSVWAIWGRLLIAEVSLESYAEHLRRQFVWTMAVLTTILLLGWMLTQFLGEVYARNVVESTQGDINLLAGRLAGETAIADGMARNIAGSPAVLPLLSGRSARSDRLARSVLDLGVETSGARFGAILDASGAVMASSDQGDVRDASTWRSAPWFQKSMTGQAGSEFSYDRASGGGSYYSSYPVRRDDGSVAGVAFLQASLDRFEADLRLLARPYFLVDPDGIVVLTNHPEAMLRTLWPLPAEKKSILERQFGPLNDQPMAGSEIRDAAWIPFDGKTSFVRRVAAPHSQWSVVMAMKKSRIYASRISGIVITLLVTLMGIFYFFGREHGIRSRIQMDNRVALQELARNLGLRAATDPLTGLYNRAKFDESLASESARSRRYNSPLALIIFDVDHFKQVNDNYGHPIGDDVLVRLSEIVLASIRETDLLARWGGEEFVILAPGQDGPTAYQAAEKLRAAIEQATFSAVGRITCSFGIAEFLAGDSAAALVARADNALYQAKKRGRNRAELASLADPPKDSMASVA